MTEPNGHIIDVHIFLRLNLSHICQVIFLKLGLTCDAHDDGGQASQGECTLRFRLISYRNERKIL